MANRDDPNDSYRWQMPRGGGTATIPGAPGGREIARSQGSSDPRDPGAGYFEGFDPAEYYGSEPGWPYEDFSLFTPGPHGAKPGAGAYGLPQAFGGWNPTARYAFPVAAQYERGMRPYLDFLEKELGKDMTGDFFGQQKDIYEAQSGEAGKKREQEFARAGYRGGGGATSPYAALQLQTEAAARAGALGEAARQSVLMEQSRKMEVGRMQQNTLASIMQAMLMPAQFGAAAGSRTPVSGGVSYIPSVINGIGALLGAGAGA